MSVSPGAVEYNTKDDKGEIISPKSADHMALFRVRCKCDINFCSSCNTTPYHVGKTCEELKDYKAASKCRVCTEKIEGEPNEMIA